MKGPPPGERGRGLLGGLPRSRLRSAVLRAGDPAAVPGSGGPPGGAGPGQDGPTCHWEERFAAEGMLPAELFGPGLPGGLERGIIFWDLETCGLADEPIFLLGCLRREGQELCLRRVLARDPSGEPALLRQGVELLAGGAVWVTFNGRSFDGPRLRRRAALHNLPVPVPAGHQDLLHLVRKRWGKSLPDCRLSTVERRLLGLERGPRDVPGREVPERYRDFVRTADIRWLEPVLEHNRRDVAAMAVLYDRLRAEGALPAAAREA